MMVAGMNWCTTVGVELVGVVLVGSASARMRSAIVEDAEVCVDVLV